MVGGAVVGSILKVCGNSDAKESDSHALSNEQKVEQATDTDSEHTNEQEELKEEEAIPKGAICFGPFLAFGIGICYLYGYDIIVWYRNLLS